MIEFLTETNKHFQTLNEKVSKIMTQLDDLNAAVLQATSDTHTLLADVASQVAGLNAQITMLQASVGSTVDLTAVIASVKALDATITAGTPVPAAATVVTPAPVSPAAAVVTPAPVPPPASDPAPTPVVADPPVDPVVTPVSA